MTRRRVLCFSQIPCKGFTLIELLVAVAAMALVLVLLMQMIGATSGYWKSTNDQAGAFRAARVAFDSITRNLSQATLNVGYDYYNAARQARMDADASTFIPSIYGRLSTLNFVSGKALIANQHTHALFFQAPLDFDPNGGLVESSSGQLNAVGYYIKYGNDSANRPSFPGAPPAPRNRFRLMEYFQPTEQLDVYRVNSGTAWFKNDVDAGKNSHVLAENIIVLAFLPKLPDAQGLAANYLADGYEYNSRMAWTSGNQPVQMHQLPPIVKVLMVAVDETSAKRDPTLGASFQNLFKDPLKFENDLAEIEKGLQDKGVNYRVFQTEVPIRSAKWSQ